jgi:hypothetical protein
MDTEHAKLKIAQVEKFAAFRICDVNRRHKATSPGWSNQSGDLGDDGPCVVLYWFGLEVKVLESVFRHWKIAYH